MPHPDGRCSTSPNPARTGPASTPETSKACRRASISIGSPSGVPVPWVSTELDGRRVNTGYGMRFGDDLRLAGGRRRIGHLDRAVVVDRRTPDDGVNAVPVVDCRQRLEDHDTDSAAEDGAIGPDVERPAVAGSRHHRSRFVAVADAVRHPDRRGTGQHHVAFARQHALAREVNCDQRRRAGRLHRKSRAAEIELVRHPRRQVVLVVLQDRLNISKVAPSPMSAFGSRCDIRLSIR